MFNLSPARRFRVLGWAIAGYTVVIIAVLVVFEQTARTQRSQTSTLAHNTTTLVDGVLLFSLAAGAGSMAVIQIAKQILGVRSFYQEYRVKQWLEGRGDGRWQPAYGDLMRALGYGKGRQRALARSEERALFNLPVDQLAAQVSIAADLAFSCPEKYPDLLAALTEEPEYPSDPPAAANSPDPSNSPDPPGPSNPPAHGGSGTGAAESEGAGAAEAAAEAADRNVRLSYRVRGGVDRLQLYVGQGWRRAVRLSAVLVSGLLGAIWVQFLNIYPSLSVAYVISALILGGFISWFLRDIVAIVERLRS